MPYIIYLMFSYVLMSLNIAGVTVLLYKNVKIVGRMKGNN